MFTFLGEKADFEKKVSRRKSWKITQEVKAVSTVHGKICNADSQAVLK